MTQIAIFGATSAIAAEAAKCFAAEGAEIVLVARDDDKLAVTSQDLITRGAEKVHTICLDLADISRHQDLFERVTKIAPELEIVFIAHGVLGDEKKSQEDFLAALEVYNVNFLSVVSLLTRFANFLAMRKRGVLAVISSVAGDRGRKSNYIYGSSKGALSLYLSGLRGRLVEQGVAVTDIRPGFVDTPMTSGLKKGPLFASPDLVGRGIYTAIKARKDVVYLPWFWRFIMLVIKLIPESIFKKSNI